MGAWRSFVDTYADLMRKIESDLSPHGLALGDYQVLVYLSEADDRTLRMCDLAELLQLTPSGTTRRLDGLVRQGWVERNPSESDRRVMLATMTKAGWRKLHEALDTHVVSVRENMIDLLNDRELKAIASAFQKVRDHLDEQRR